jgi:hypothetical protein
MKVGAVALVLLFSCAQAPVVPAVPGKGEAEAVFDRASALSGNHEIARRMLTPLTYRRGEEAMKASGKGFNPQPLDIAKERFSIYVPGGEPPKDGWGLVVFMSPINDPIVALLWRTIWDRHRLIYVSPNNGGNEEKVYDRRVPLALLAYENVKARHPIDPDRTYISGLSGGSRMAELIALGYPDIFRGALLDAGSDPIGGKSGTYAPPLPLFAQFQKNRLVYVSGSKDELNLADDQVSRASMRDFCVFNVAVTTAVGLAHEMLDQVSLEKAVRALEKPDKNDEGKIARCNERLHSELATRIKAVEETLARGDRQGARLQLAEIDSHYGGVAAAEILRLDDELNQK